MAADPAKADTERVLTKLRSQNANKACFDCGSKNPSWSSVTYGIFICIDCSAVHRSLGVHLSFVRSTLLDTSWNWNQLRAMQVGGNANAHLFFKQHNCNTKDPSQKYNSRVAQLYRDKLSLLVANSFKLYGHVLEIPSLHSSSEKSETTEDSGDFWDNHSIASLSISQVPEPSKDSLLIKKPSNTKEIRKDGPNVNMNTQANINEYKASVIGKKQTTVKKGLGTKKGMGAQKVQTDFNKLEQEALEAEKFKESNSMHSTTKLSPEEQHDKSNSIKLAYQDLSEKQKISEDKMKSIDPNKASQFERLGMGFGNVGLNRVSSNSHSAVRDMQVIEQVNPVSSNRIKDLPINDSFGNDSDYSNSYKYKDFVKQSDDDFWNDNGVFAKKPTKKADIIESITTIDLDRNHSKSQKPKQSSYSGSNNGSSSTEQAQKKFGNAKAISSDQYFDNDKSSYEDKSNVRRFEGSRGISSDDYFGRSSSIPNHPSYSTNFNSTNLYDIKEGVKDSVNKIAGRLSNVASDVVNIMNRFDGMK